MKMTKKEKYWILYDVGNSAFVLLATTIFPIYFNYLAQSAGISEVDYLAYWGYAASITTIIVMVIGPVAGTLADTKNYKRRLFFWSLLLGVISCGAMAFQTSWIWFLGIFILAKVGLNVSLIFYDSMLGDITTEERMDMISSQGYAWGYIGSCIPFVISLALVLLYEKIGITMQLAMILAFMLNALWWFVVTIPLLKVYEQKNYIEAPEHPFREGIGRLFHGFNEVRKDKKIFIFMLAFFFYIDGVYTIIDMATAYGQSLGLDSSGLLLALLTTQIVAFPFALIFGKLASKYPTGTLIRVCIFAYFLIALFACQLDRQWEFWVLAVCVGMFQGGIQALSRSYFAKIVPAEKSGEYFGIYDICGKGASFVGTFLVGLVSQITGKTNLGVSVLVVMFVAGFLLFGKAVKLNGETA